MMKTHLLAILLIGLRMVAISQNANTAVRTIEVTGSAEMEIIPNQIYVSFDLREYDSRGNGKTPISVIKENFLNYCRKVNIEDSLIALDSYEALNRYDWWKRKGRKEDFYTSVSFIIRFPTVQKLELLLEELDENATQSVRIASLHHSNMPDFRKQLKIDAIKAAREKAIYLTGAIGEKLGNAVEIIENNDQTTDYTGRMIGLANSERSYMDGNKIKSGGYETAFKKIKLNYSVKVIFSLQ